MSSPCDQAVVLLDPPSRVFSRDRLFELAASDVDGHLKPLLALRDALASRGMGVHTAYWLDATRERRAAFLISLCRMREYRGLVEYHPITLVSFLAAEPPVVAPKVYHALPSLSRLFRKVYLYNTEGSGFETSHSPAGSLRKLYIAQSRRTVSERHWQNDQRKLITMINANKGAGTRPGELYSERIRAVVELARLGEFDLYGRGWSLQALSPREWLQVVYLHTRGQVLPRAYWQNRRALLACYRGSVHSKLDVLGQYDFSVCYENMVMPGYITEKMFDCFFAGNVPVYLGAPDIAEYIPREAFIDRRDFSSYADLHEYLSALPKGDIKRLREAGREYVHSDSYLRFSTERFVQRMAADVEEAIGATGIG